MYGTWYQYLYYRYMAFVSLHLNLHDRNKILYYSSYNYNTKKTIGFTVEVIFVVPPHTHMHTHNII